MPLPILRILHLCLILLSNFSIQSSREFFRDIKYFYSYTISKNNNLSVFFIKFVTDLDTPTKVNFHTLLIFKSKGTQFIRTIEGQKIINLVSLINVTKKKNTKLNTMAVPMAVKLSKSKDKILLFEQTMSAVLNFIEYGTLIEIFFEDNTFQKITRVEYAINSGTIKGTIYEPIDPKSILIENINDLFKIHRRKVNKFEIDIDTKNINFVDNTFFSTTMNDISMINSQNDKNSKNDSVLEELDTLKNEIKSPFHDHNMSKYGFEDAHPNSILKKKHPGLKIDTYKEKKNPNFVKRDYGTDSTHLDNKPKIKVMKKPIKIKKKDKIKIENLDNEETENKQREIEEIENNTSVLGFALISVLIGLESTAVIVLLVYMKISKINVKVNERDNNVDMVLEEFEYRK